MEAKFKMKLKNKSNSSESNCKGTGSGPWHFSLISERCCGRYDPGKTGGELGLSLVSFWSWLKQANGAPLRECQRPFSLWLCKSPSKSALLPWRAADGKPSQPAKLLSIQLSAQLRAFPAECRQELQRGSEVRPGAVWHQPIREAEILPQIWISLMTSVPTQITPDFNSLSNTYKYSKLNFFLLLISSLHLDQPVKIVHAADLFVFTSIQLYLYGGHLTAPDWKVSPAAGYLIWCWQLFQFPFCFIGMCSDSQAVPWSLVV